MRSLCSCVGTKTPRVLFQLNAVPCLPVDNWLLTLKQGGGGRVRRSHGDLGRGAQE